MNDPSGDFEKEKSRLLTSAESGSGAREQPRAHQATVEEVNDQVRRHALHRSRTVWPVPTARSRQLV